VRGGAVGAAEAAGAAAGPTLLQATTYRVVSLADLTETQAAVAWWTDLTEGGGEGMVVKPYDFVPASGRALVQPTLKCRGREYLRLIYGPDYLLPIHLTQ